MDVKEQTKELAQLVNLIRTEIRSVTNKKGQRGELEERKT